jgi:hypothetical protein
MRRITGILTALGITLYFIAAGSLTAHAATTTIEFTAEDFYIPRPADRSDQVGVERLLASVQVPAGLVGTTCSVVGTSTNGESVHPNNFGVLRSNGDSVTITGTEDEANGVRLSDRTIVLGATVDLYNIMQPDANGIVATSVNYLVRVTCTTDDTTTTTTPPSSTSTSPESTSTSTTIPTTTTSSNPFATTTTVPTDSTTSTLPPTTSTTQPDTSTSTTAPTDSTSTTAGTGTSITTLPPVTSSTLPFTGPPVEAAGMVMAGLAFLVLGGAVLLAGRER